MLLRQIEPKVEVTSSVRDECSTLVHTSKSSGTCSLCMWWRSATTHGIHSMVPVVIIPTYTKNGMIWEKVYLETFS